jgi:hypothetical protein
VEPGLGGGGDQLHLGVGKDPVIAERAAEQAGRHDGHALGVQVVAMDVACWRRNARQVVVVRRGTGSSP